MQPAAVVPTLSIIGPGRLGKTIGRLLVQAGVAQILDVLARTPENGAEAVTFIGAGTVAPAFSALRSADVVLLAVPDDQIAACCHELAATGIIHAGMIVFHCSGAHSSAILSAARAVGAQVASVHPVRSFADPAKVAAYFAGTFCGVEGQAGALAILTPLFEAIGAKLVAIDGSAKTLYHAAAVFASNYLVTLIDTAVQVYGKAGVPPALALQMIEPLLLETATNVFAMGPAAALTGPVARGDVATVRRQTEALAACDPAVAVLYARLAEATAALAATRGR